MPRECGASARIGITCDQRNSPCGEGGRMRYWILRVLALHLLLFTLLSVFHFYGVYFIPFVCSFIKIFSLVYK